MIESFIVSITLGPALFGAVMLLVLHLSVDQERRDGRYK